MILSLSPEFSGFSVHIHTYLVRPKTRADPGIKLCPPCPCLLLAALPCRQQLGCGFGALLHDADDGDGGTSDDAAGQRYGTRFSELLFLRAAGSAVLDPLASRGGNMLPGLLRADAPLGSTAAEFEEFIRQHKVIVG